MNEPGNLFTLILMGIAVLILIWALKTLYRMSESRRTGGSGRTKDAGKDPGNSGKYRRNQKNKDKGQKHSNCPLCNSDLYPGENIVSRVYKGFDAKDQACTIHGCPYCYPIPRPGVIRTCPVCHKQVPPNGHLDAHLFLRAEGKRHIHITGCTECHKH